MMGRLSTPYFWRLLLDIIVYIQIVGTIRVAKVAGLLSWGKRGDRGCWLFLKSLVRLATMLVSPPVS